MTQEPIAEEAEARRRFEAVKAALHRGRQKLERAVQAPRPTRTLEPRHRAIVERYLAAFNARDWQGVRDLVTEDARLEVVGRASGPLAASRYFTNYGSLPERWTLALALVDGMERVVHFREEAGTWVPRAIVQLRIDGDRVAVIRDYLHIDYQLQHCEIVIEI